ncbi:uncharacterized mitochondrial protein AtMg00860-like [Arachis duranensis]|uniref:Uncharacterized mitochondrial protein AtMg00860-like n=1 Tax=Arachis duranensis TaxID=130453 RepID=A0A6P4CZS0_ARADU|nr:uncharacterized mitochondrial protein AtMg00860-like [Arachis duranensis]XP_025692339.1 uncharacterized protein LOC112794560 [Arachis hypogaea]
MEYLGHIVGSYGVKIDPSKIEAIQVWPKTNSLKQLRGFLELMGYYRKFVANYAQIAHPLTELLKKNNFYWGEEADRAFEQLKAAMIHTLVLALSDFSMPFTVEVDASHKGIVVVDGFTKVGYFTALKPGFTARDAAKAFINLVVKLHGFSVTMVSNRDPIFLSKFRKTLFKFSGTQLSYNTAYHPQIDAVRLR